MKRSSRLNPVLELAETREKQAALELGQSRQKLEAAEKSLANLHKFRENYSARFLQSGDKGLGARQLTEYRAFLEKINKAIVDQERAVHKAETDAENRRKDWEAARRHMLGLGKIVENAKREEARAEERALQAETDERASRRNARAGEPLLAMYF